MIKIIVTLFILGVIANVYSSSSSPYYTIYSRGSHYEIKNVNDPSGIATAFYNNSMNATGWDFLNIKSNKAASDYDQMYASGYLEGALTTGLIYDYYQSLFISEYNSTDLSTNVTNWLDLNNVYMLQNIKEHPTDPYWMHIALILAQMNGMMDGYNAFASDSKQFDVYHFLLLNMDGDMADLQAAVDNDTLSMDDKSIIERYIFRNSHCSSLVKVADDFSELYIGHTTWSGYYEMLRIYKTYDFPLSTKKASQVTTFSGYPGVLSSVDDYYVLDTGLVVTETTNGVMNNSLYELVLPNSVLSFIRVQVANRMASNGKEWVDIFSVQNSGTYNNQWIVVDTNKLSVGSQLLPGALYILEQIPGYIESADVTGILTYGYWPSYNVPYFDNIYAISGFAQYEQTYGAFFAYQANPRAEIFRRDSDTVTNISTFGKILRYNDYAHDPLSQGTPCYAISSRFDLVQGNNPNPFLVKDAFGGVDSKITSASLAKNMTSWIQSGPTHDNNPPFAWTKEWDSVASFSQPRVFDFPWVEVHYSL